MRDGDNGGGGDEYEDLDCHPLFHLSFHIR